MDGDSERTDPGSFPVLDLHSISDAHPVNDEALEVSPSTRNLIECSELEDEALMTICCNDWREAAVGWQHTVPCVKYAWAEQPKKQPVGAHGEGKKNRNKLKSNPKEFNWRATIDPGTYRYSPSRLYCTTTAPAPSSDTSTNDEDVQLHIELVRNHFERTLKCANSPAKLPREREQFDNVDYPKESVSEGALRELEGSVNSHGRRESNLLEGNLIHSSSLGILDQPSSEEQRHLNHIWQQYQVHHVQNTNNPFSPHPLKETPVSLNRSVQYAPSKCQSSDNGRSHSLLTGWGSGFVVEAESLLNPLKKVTPQQRQVYDDNEATELFPSNISPPPTTSHGLSPQVKPLSSKGVRNQTALFIPIRVSGHSDVKRTAGKIQTDNTSKFTQDEFSLAKELQSIQDILRAQKYLSQEPKKKPERQRHKPHRLRKLPSHAGAGDVNPGNGDLGEPLHRGIIDRKTALDLAAELLPGISGQRLEPPLYAYRII